LTRETPIAEEFTGAQNGDYRLFARWGDNHQFYLAPPEVK
jgi:hypothetical protein